jgi:hypothetical protein
MNMVLQQGLSAMIEQYEIEKLRLPLCPSFACKELLVDKASHFNSAAKPIALHFLGENGKYSIIYKVGLVKIFLINLKFFRWETI